MSELRGFRLGPRTARGESIVKSAVKMVSNARKVVSFSGLFGVCTRLATTFPCVFFLGVRSLAMPGKGCCNCEKEPQVYMLLFGS